MASFQCAPSSQVNWVRWKPPRLTIWGSALCANSMETQHHRRVYLKIDIHWLFNITTAILPNVLLRYHQLLQFTQNSLLKNTGINKVAEVLFRHYIVVTSLNSLFCDVNLFLSCRMQGGCCTWDRMSGPTSTAASGLQRCTRRTVPSCRCIVLSREGAIW